MCNQQEIKNTSTLFDQQYQEKWIPILFLNANYVIKTENKLSSK